jgi:hypothetical protein
VQTSSTWRLYICSILIINFLFNGIYGYLLTYIVVFNNSLAVRYNSLRNFLKALDKLLTYVLRKTIRQLTIWAKYVILGCYLTMKKPWLLTNIVKLFFKELSKTKIIAPKPSWNRFLLSETFFLKCGGKSL